ncbi:CaiB/BaiF CoA transferase family protein [Futiania mangrovi]|uniref:CoA transferase n=1 Tax=Futiania mangrovi TaxID=2959716 RepID=A0A9J6PFY2_9PROT|nr:CoA transferase [Futiania mangrovii]MCP1337382.1 CoA transferase [Futiania mangrovii]
MAATGAADKAKPMAGVLVLDCATFIAGPTCATLLGEFGAEVIKVELPGTGCPLRKFGTMTEVGASLPWLSESRNKKSLTLDLRTPGGADILKRLAAQSHILIENFQPGTMEGWGLGWEDLKAVNPALVMVRITAYGQTGPYRDRPGFGRIANAFGGISYLAGDPDRPPVTPGSATLPDYMSGLYGALGAMMALRVAERTGEGQVVDLGLYESIFRILDELAPAYAYNGTVRERMGPGTVNVCPHSHYPTADGKWIAIACTNDKIFARLAALMGHPELAGEGKWGKTADRLAARSEVDAFVADWTARYTAAELLEMCEGGQVPCGRLLSIAEIFEDPQYAARGNIARMAHAVLGEVAVPNVVPRLMGTPGEIESLGPELGADTDAILEDLLGLGAEERAALKAKGAI